MVQVLKVEHIEKYYGNKNNLTKAIDDLSMSVSAGEFVGIMGPSGSGKTTLLNCISTLDAVTSGHIYISGEDITGLKGGKLAAFRRQNLGFIFQDYNLLDTLTVYENIALAFTIQGAKPAAFDSSIRRVAHLLGIEICLNKFPYELSGGQNQRAAAARAIVTQPSLIMADEPTGALDSKSSRTLLELLSKMNTKLGATIVMVTHDPLTASYAQRILFLRDGKLYHELACGDDPRPAFFDRIVAVTTVMGGDADHVR
ncbi:MAG: ABC transporter ATP-binding protein [Sporolactobacillus sp.]|jgi:putative ABC transport system ATP-binding protein|nr:ABC transporter ATP-binding protein [Sporolactobacillus sp.]